MPGGASFWYFATEWLFTLAISKCYGKVRVLFFRATTLVSACKSHSSGVRDLVVRCLPPNPECSGSNPCVCAMFFTNIPKQKVPTFSALWDSPLFRLCETFFESFLMFPKDSPFIFFDILQQNKCLRILKGPFFHIFRHYETVKNSQFLFSKSFQSLKGSHSIFFEILQQNRC